MPHKTAEGRLAYSRSPARKAQRAIQHSRPQFAEWRYRYRYGITLADRDAIFAAQGSKCKICDTEDPGAKGWHTDHDHQTKKVRGILCGNCNNALGLLKDSSLLVARAIAYLLGIDIT